MSDGGFIASWYAHACLPYMKRQVLKHKTNGFMTGIQGGGVQVLLVIFKILLLHESSDDHGGLEYDYSRC